MPRPYCRADRAAGAIAVLLMGVAVTGCSSGPPLPTFKYIFVSEIDCVDSDKVKADDCRKAIDKALIDHDKIPIKFPTFADCEKSEGAERCERVAERHWRPRLMAFLFTTKGPAVSAQPLLAGLKGATVYRDAGGATFDWERTEGITFSREAIRKAEGFAPPSKQRRG
jgi:uncharacterized protein YgiB involved in biofilm formation